MIKFSKERAREAGMLRKSEEHGKDEWKAVITESFAKKMEKIQEKEQKASEAMEAGDPVMISLIWSEGRYTHTPPVRQCI